MALTTNRNVDHYIDQELRSYPVGAAKRVYSGGWVGLAATGYAQALVAGDAVAGLAYEECDNSAGAAGAKSVRVYTQGDFGVTLAGATVASIGRPVFASADDALTFTANGNSFVGLVQDVPVSGEIILRLDVGAKAVKTICHAVEDLAAGADIAARAVHSFEGDAWIVSARVVNQATASAGINDANTCVIALATGAGTVATKTYNTTVLFPGANLDDDLGAVTNAHAAAGSVLTLAVTNGAAANPGPFLVCLDYV